MLRNHCKKVEGQIDGLLADFPADGATKLKSLRLNYETQLKKVSDANDDVLALITTEEDLKADMEDSLLLEDVFYGYLTKIEVKLAELSLVDSKPTPKDSKADTKTATSSTSFEETVKTPKIEPPSFDGNIMNWQSWWDQYEAAVHKQPKLSDVNKFVYLKRLLNTKAQECISGLSLTNENYTEAIDLLKERYGNKQLLINAYIENFENLQVVRSMSQVAKLRTLYDAVESTIRNLKTLKVDATTYGGFLSPLLSKKLPSELKMIMSRKFKNDVWDIKQMMDMFKEELEAKERCSFNAKSEKKEDVTSDDELSYSTSNLHVQQVPPPKKTPRQRKPPLNANKPKCIFCGQAEHETQNCPNVTNVQTRKEMLKNMGRCFVCLTKGHRSGNCRKQYQCRKCGKRHHVCICDGSSPSAPSQGPHLYSSPDGVAQFPIAPQYFPSQNGQFMNFDQPSFNPYQNQQFYPATNCYQTSLVSAPSRYPPSAPPALNSTATSPVYQYARPATPVTHPSLFSNPIVSATGFVPGLSTNANPHAVTPTTSHCSIVESKSTLMGTARTEVCNPYEEEVFAFIRMLFDNASQRTYVTSCLKDKLQVPVLKKDTVLVKGFGGVESELKEVDIILIKVRTLVGHPDILIEAVVVPVVCAPLPNQNTKTVKMCYPHLQNLFLADFSDDENKKVDILLGLDYYWSIVTGFTVHGKPGSPVASYTSLGWIVSGVSKLPPSQDVSSLTTVCLKASVHDEREGLKSFFENESVIEVDSKSKEDNVLYNFKNDIAFNGEKYVVKLPEKTVHDFLPDNYWLAKKGLIANEKRLAKHPDPNMAEKYQ